MDAGAGRLEVGSREARARLCLVVGQLERGGLEKQSCLLALGLRERGFDVVVVSLSPGGAWAAALQTAGVAVVQLRRRGRFDVLRFAGLVAEFRRLRPDLVYAFNYPTTIYARLAGLLTSVPVLLTGERGIYMTRAQGLLERLLTRITECVICNAEAIRRDLVERVGLPAGKVITVRNAIEPAAASDPRQRETARDQLGIPREAFLAGTVGHVEEIKNLPMLIETAVLCRDEGFPARFCIVGGGQVEALRALTRERGVDDRVVLTGESSSVPLILKTFDVFVLTSRMEGLPNTVMEAMAAGLPCVCTDVGGCRELVEDGVTGFLIPPGDAASLARRLRQLADDPRLRASMGAAGRARMLRDFSLDTLLSRTESVLRILLAERGRRSRGSRLTARPAAGGS